MPETMVTTATRLDRGGGLSGAQAASARSRSGRQSLNRDRFTCDDVVLQPRISVMQAHLVFARGFRFQCILGGAPLDVMPITPFTFRRSFFGQRQPELFT